MPSDCKFSFTKMACVAILIALGSGCARIINSSNSLVWREHEPAAGLVVLLNGIEGTHAFHQGTLAGLRAGGVKANIQVHDWTTGTPLLFLMHLQHDRFHEIASHEFAAKLSRYRDQHPATPISIVAHSGGTRIAARCIELLPINTVDKVIFVSSALSPQYPINQLSERVRTAVWNFRSSYLDTGLLACGTILAGTMDNRHTVSAGMVGFNQSPCVPKLVEVPYSLSNIEHLDFGGHYGGLTYFTARDRLAPILNDAFAPSGYSSDFERHVGLR